MDFPWAVPAPRNHRQTVPACGVCYAKRMISSKHPGPRFTLLPLAGCRLCGQLTGQRGPTEVLSSICHPLSQLCPPLNDISGKAQSVLLAFCLRRRRTAYSSVNLVWHILSLSSRGASWSCARGSGKGGPREGLAPLLCLDSTVILNIRSQGWVGGGSTSAWLSAGRNPLGAASANLPPRGPAHSLCCWGHLPGGLPLG